MTMLVVRQGEAPMVIAREASANATTAIEARKANSQKAGDWGPFSCHSAQSFSSTTTMNVTSGRTMACRRSERGVVGMARRAICDDYQPHGLERAVGQYASRRGSRTTRHASPR